MPYTRLGECLAASGVITREQLQEALRIQQERKGFLGKILIEQGWITDTQLCRAISKSLDVNCVSIDNLLVSEDIIRMIPGSLAATCNIFPIFVHDQTLYLAMENPADTGVIQLVEYHTGMQVKPLTAPSSQLQMMIEKCYHLSEKGKKIQIARQPESEERCMSIQEDVVWKGAYKLPQFQKKRLGEFLVESGRLSREELEDALRAQHEYAQEKVLGQIIVEMGLMTEDEVCTALGDLLEIESVDIEDVHIDPEVIRLVPESLADSCNVLPLFIEHEILYLAMENPLDIGVVQLIEYSTHTHVEPLLAAPRQLRKMIKRHYQLDE